MTKKNLKILLNIFKNNISLIKIGKSIVEYLFYFILLNILFKNIKYLENFSNDKILIISSFYLFIIVIYKYFYKNICMFRYLVVTNRFDLILLKPINTIFGILINEVNISDLIVVLPGLLILVYLDPLKYILIIIFGLMFSITIFIFSISLIKLTSGKYALKKLLLVLFLIGILIFINLAGIISSILITIAFFISSLKFWQFVLIKHSNASS